MTTDLPQTRPADDAATIAEMEKAWDRLRTIQPVILDLTLRESAVGTPKGPVLADKMKLLDLARSMGFRDILLGTFDVSLESPDQVDDQFCKMLRDTHKDLTGGFAFTGIGKALNGSFTPDRSMEKARDYTIPNVIVDVDISLEYLKKDMRAGFLKDLPASIQWFHDSLHRYHGDDPRIYINYQDMTDAFFEDWEWVAQVTKMLSGQRITGVTFEDGRGTAFPFQVAAMTKVLRNNLGPQKTLLAHMHAGSGMENANLIEALLNGADGIWAGLAREGPTIGHASGSEFLANLLRCGNTRIGQMFAMHQLLPVVREVTGINTGNAIPNDFPIIGSNAYRAMLSAFIQKDGQKMDLPPEKIGGKQGYRIAPVTSDNAIVMGRLREVGIQLEPGNATEKRLKRMREIMREDLLANCQREYDLPDVLKDLYNRSAPGA
jgi:hypothetical protein